MARYAIKQDEHDEYKLLEFNPATGKWAVCARNLDDDELADEIFEMLEEDDLDANDEILKVTPDGRSKVRAIELVKDWQRRRLGYVIDAQPVAGRARDAFSR